MSWNDPCGDCKHSKRDCKCILKPIVVKEEELDEKHKKFLEDFRESWKNDDKSWDYNW